MNKNIERIRRFVKKECDEWNWKYHIVPVIKYAKLLAQKLNANEEIVELAALLHDIGRVKFGPKNHEKTGIPEAEKILKEFHYPQEVINEIKHCIESHRGSGTIKPRTLVAKIIRNADAISHFDIIPALIQVALQIENNDLEKAFEWVYEKIEREWNRKLTIPEAREITKEKYEAFKILFNSMKEYI